MNKLALTALCAGSLLSGCATVVNGSTEDMHVVATPSDAKITLSTNNHTFVDVQDGAMDQVLKRGNGVFKGRDYVLKVSKKGYQTQTVKLNSQVSAWYAAGNVLIWPGYFIDPFTGAMWTFDASNGQDVDNLNIYLQEKDSSETAQAKAPTTPVPAPQAKVPSAPAPQAKAPTTEAKTKN
ncbi:hypothetical protein L4C34_11360 [Vibrio profundum]|uniref:hypothetical protein n=1 Tax=Vibrio profundum TaxID=2910247 RepID=UPI003D0C28E2